MESPTNWQPVLMTMSSVTIFLTTLFLTLGALLRVLNRKNKHLLEKHIECRMLFDSSRDAVVKVDQSRKIRDINPSGEKMFNYKQASLIGKNINRLVALSGDRDVDEKIMRYFHFTESGLFYNPVGLDCQRSDGSVFTAELIVTEQVLIDQSEFFMAIFRDLSVEKSLESELLVMKDKLKQSNLRVKHLLQYETLTEITDRDLFDRRIEEELKRARRENADLSLIVCDVDYLKQFGDIKGPVGVEDVLKRVAEVIHSQLFRSVDLLARYGGETFSIILPSTSLDGALIVANRIQNAIRGENIPNPASFTADRLTLSIGVTAVHPKDHHQSGPLIERADQALFLAKNKGRNRIEQIR